MTTPGPTVVEPVAAGRRVVDMPDEHGKTDDAEESDSERGYEHDPREQQ